MSFCRFKVFLGHIPYAEMTYNLDDGVHMLKQRQAPTASENQRLPQL
jgi:hypothetical protein